MWSGLLSLPSLPPPATAPPPPGTFSPRCSSLTPSTGPAPAPHLVRHTTCLLALFLVCRHFSPLDCTHHSGEGGCLCRSQLYPQLLGQGPVPSRSLKHIWEMAKIGVGRREQK